MDSRIILHIAKYPFLRSSREYVASLNLSLDDILAHPIYSAALEMGLERVSACLAGRYRADLDERRLELTVLSYPVARMLSYLIGSATWSKYAEGEAKAAFELLEGEESSVISEISADLGIQVHDGSMPVVQYTTLASPLARQNPKWKLSNRNLQAGKVEVKTDELPNLLREAVKNRVMEPIDSSRIPQAVKKTALNLKIALAGARTSIKIEQLEAEALPPCIRGMVSAMEAGVASHNAMFILATFLANLGLGLDDIVAVFSKSPKFDEEKTRYQMGFISGEKSGTEYTCPACVTIKSHGLCKGECPVKHPLQYYRHKAKVKPKNTRK